MTQHTPGPWMIQAEKHAGERQWWVYAENAPRGHRLPAICSGPNALANARLIAAAPEMLAMLKAFNGWGEDAAHVIEAFIQYSQEMRKIGKGFSPSGLSGAADDYVAQGLRQTMDKARALLARISGENNG